jgi:hypothetical protein
VAAGVAFHGRNRPFWRISRDRQFDRKSTIAGHFRSVTRALDRQKDFPSDKVDKLSRQFFLNQQTSFDAEKNSYTQRRGLPADAPGSCPL